MAGEMEQAWFHVARVFWLSLFASGFSGEYMCSEIAARFVYCMAGGMEQA